MLVRDSGAVVIIITARCLVCQERLTWPLWDYTNVDGRPVHRTCIGWRVRATGGWVE